MRSTRWERTRNGSASGSDHRDFEQIFVDPTKLVFTPQHDVRTIDSSIDSLEDRPSLSTVRGAVGLPSVPIIAPSIDLNGQLRIDDPDVDAPTGIGQSVFKDRGAEDRGTQSDHACR